MPFSVKSLLNDTQITLEKAATDKFGSVVDSFVAGGLGGLIPKTSGEPPVNRNDGSWYATSYAAALAGGTNYRPKLKFLFKVEFIFTEAAKAMYSDLGKPWANDFTFMIKSVDRPKIDFEYEEDVNMYNFRTKVLKKIRHRDLTIVFMDDAGNRVFDFFRMLMMIHSPITRGQRDRDGTLQKPTSAKAPEFGSGMSFGQHAGDTAHRGAVNSAFGNSIEAIRVKQIFVDSGGALEDATQMVSFDFMNPRIISFDMDELSHETNDVSLLTMIFDYDWMEMVKIGALGKKDTKYEVDYNIQAKGVHGAPSDITPNKSSGSDVSAMGAGKGNPLVDGLSGILGRGASQLTSDLVGKAVKSVAGNGRFATTISGIASNSLSGPIQGLVQGASRDRMNGLVSSITSPNARATQSMVSDSNTAGADKTAGTQFASDAYAGNGPAPAQGDYNG